MDAGRDAGPLDAGALDASAPLDAFVPTLDAAPPEPDAGTAMSDAAVAIDAGRVVDAGRALDAGAVDAGTAPCTSAASCSDGLACNGIERCEAGRCVPGTAIVCDDGIACTADTCREPGTCAYAAMDALCPSGQVCGATGCVGGGACTESPCRLVSPQCGCAAGQACYLAAGARVCGVAGAATEGTACMGSSTCQTGLDCINYSSDPARPASQCARFCSTDADCAGAGSLCLGELSDGMGGTLAGVRMCTRSCNAFRNTGCAAGLSCQIFRERTGAMRFLTECGGPSGVGTTADPCTTNADCAAGYACFTGATGGECYHWCNLGSGAGCGAFELCEPLTVPVIIGSVSYGVCTPF